MSPKSTVTMQVMSLDTSLRDLLQWMMQQQISHCEMPFGEAESYVHLALVFDRVESSKLSAHLDTVTLTAIQKANARLGGGGS